MKVSSGFFLGPRQSLGVIVGTGDELADESTVGTFEKSRLRLRSTRLADVLSLPFLRSKSMRKR